MRKIKEILFDWAKLLNENGTNDLSDEQIKEMVNNEIKSQILLQTLLESLKEKVEINGRLRSTTKAFYIFCTIVLKEDPSTGQYIWNNFVKKQFELIEFNDQSCYIAARSHGKSFVAFCLYPIFKAFSRLGFEAILCSNIPKMVKRNFRVLKRLIDTNELLLMKKRSGNMRDLKWTESEIEYNDGYIETISMGTTPRSAHVDYVAIDDPLRDDKKMTNEYIVNFVQGSIRLCILRKKGKMAVSGCVNPNTRVITEEGLVKIGGLVDYDADKKQLIPFKKKVFGKGGWDETSNFFVNGKVKTNKIILANGYELECSEIHPVWSCPGKNKWIVKREVAWVKSNSLKVGDFVAIKSGTNVFGKEKLNVDPYLLGLYISEGSSEINKKANRLTITNSNEYIMSYLKNLGFHNTEGIHNRLGSKDLINRMKLDKVVFTTSNFKMIPESIFRTTRINQINFLQGLYDGDGHSTICFDERTKRKYLQVVLTSANKLLILDVQQILLNFGIITAINKSYHKEHYKSDGGFIRDSISFSLTCSGDDAKKYLDEIGFRIGYKQKNVDFELQKRKEHFGFIWKRIKSITKSENYTVDFVIPKTHSFISNGIVSHNTPQHEGDLFHTLMRKTGSKTKICSNGEISEKGFCCDIFPAITNWEKQELLVPEIYDWEQLMKERSSIGEYRFQRELMVNCISFEGSLIGRSLFLKCCNEKDVKGNPLSMMQVGAEGKRYFITMDCATSDALSADYSAFTVWELDNDGKIICRHLWHEKGYPINDPDGMDDDQIHVGAKLSKDFNNAVCIIETNSPGISLKQGLEGLGVECIGRVTGSNKVNEIVDYIEAMKNGNIIFPSDPEDEFTLQMLEKIKNEHLNFGSKKKGDKEVFEALAGHDDIFDACYFAWAYIISEGDDDVMAIVI